MKYLEVNDRQYRALIGAGIGLVLGIFFATFIVISGPSVHALALPGIWIIHILSGFGLAPYGEQSFSLAIMTGIIFWPFFMTVIGGVFAYTISRK